MEAQVSSGSVAAAAQPHPIRLIIGTLLHMLLLPGSLVLGVPYKLLALGDGLAVTRTALQLLTGILCIAVGVVLLAVCTWDFMVSGKGTPNPLDPPRILVRQRLYRYVRNPFYIAVVMMVVGEAFVFAAPVLIGYA